MLSCFNKIKNIFTNKHWIVTCITQDLEIFLQNMFNSYEEAYENMMKYYNEITNDLGSAVLETHIFPESATIIYDDDPCVFEFKITCIENKTYDRRRN